MAHLKTVFAAALFFALIPATAFAQPAQARVVKGNAPGGGGGPGGAQISGGAGGMMQHRKELLEALQEQLGATDEEWKSLSQKIEKVLDARQKTNTGAGMGWTSRNGGKPSFQPSTSSPDTPTGKAMREVRDVVPNKDTPKEQVAKKLASLRAAKEKAKADLDAAQADLRKSLTPWQEAVLVTLGIMD
jgi:Spy/CpxP family protein refolding chaperone